MAASPQKSKVNADLQSQLDLIAIRYVAQVCKESVPRGDMAAAESAFCSEMAVSHEYGDYFPFLKTGRRGS